MCPATKDHTVVVICYKNQRAKQDINRCGLAGVFGLLFSLPLSEKRFRERLFQFARQKIRV